MPPGRPAPQRGSPPGRVAWTAPSSSPGHRTGSSAGGVPPPGAAAVRLREGLLQASDLRAVWPVEEDAGREERALDARLRPTPTFYRLGRPRGGGPRSTPL